MFVKNRGLQRDIVCLGWPIAPSYMSPNAGGGGVAGPQPMSIAVYRSPNKLWRSKSIFNLWDPVSDLARLFMIRPENLDPDSPCLTYINEYWQPTEGIAACDRIPSREGPLTLSLTFGRRIWPEWLQRLISKNFIKVTYVGFLHNLSCLQCWGSGFRSAGYACFWASRIRILPFSLIMIEK